VNFDGTTSSENLAGTYSQSGTTVTVTTVSNHNLSQGQGIYANITTGTGVDGSYTVATITSPTVFTYTAGTSLTTSGNITLNRSSIRSQYNVSSVTKNGTGDYTVNFATAMADANYSVNATGSIASTNATSGFIASISDTITPRTNLLFRIITANSSFVTTECAQVSVSVFGN
jgi:hypothetical protein